MKLGILICDDVQPALQPAYGHYPAMFEQLFLAVDPSLQFQHYDVRQGEYPEDLDTCDGYITTGSRHSVNESLAWIDGLALFIRTLHTAGKPFVGICFGHQLLARALGGEVERAACGWGIGVYRCQLASPSAWMTPALDSLALVASHQDQVCRLPEGAQVLARSDFCPFYMIQLGPNMLGLQGHPEFSTEYAAALINSRRNCLPPEQVEAGLATLNQSPDTDSVARWLLAFISAASAWP